MEHKFERDMKNAFSKAFTNTEIFVYDTVGSTNDEARSFALANSGKDAFFIAKAQSAGRGRRGRSFISREGGLYISYLLHPKLSIKDSIMLTVFSAVALSETIEELTCAKPKIKWVNDLFLGGKKIAGILAEGGFKSDGEGFEYAVVGIGVNLVGKEIDPEIEGIASTLEKEIGIKVDIIDFALKFAKKLSSFEEELADSYMRSYRERSAVIGKRVKMTSAGDEFYCDVLRIEDDGAITVKLDGGEEKSFYSAEVSVAL